MTSDPERPAPKLDLDNEALALDYDRISATRQFETGKRLVAELGIKADEHVLDVGCGTGLLAEHIADIVGPRGMVLGIDPLPLRIELARRKTRANLAFDVGDARDLSMLAAASFDVVVLNAVFHWLPEKSGPLAQFLRVLKKGGRLGLTSAERGERAPMHAAISAALKNDPLARYPRPREGWAHRVTADELRQLLERAGFRIELLEARENVQHHASAAAALRFAEASSFGNVFAHLPEALKPAAREAAIRELGRVTGPDGSLERRSNRLVAVAVKA
jgi:ubiquinone/menaquinone biosynthesis C-methylase UbiE